MRTRYTLILLLFCLFITPLSAQQLAVESFRLLERDLTANLEGTKRIDPNTRTPAALIKVVTSETNFFFDGGLLGLVGDCVQTVGEIWVYVPPRAKQITIKHQQLGVLRNYYYPVPIESGRTYEMRLVTGHVQQIVHQDAGGQFLMMTVTPPNAQVTIDGTPRDLPADGVLSLKLPYGAHEYLVTAPLHHTEMGRFEITREGKTKVNVPLRPNYGILQVNSTPQGAEVTIDGEYKAAGTTPFTTEWLSTGTHKLQFRMPSYKTYTAEVEVVGDGSTQPYTAAMQPNFAQVSVTAPDSADIYINDERKGVSSWQGTLTPGLYTLEARKAGHHSTTKNIEIVAGEAQNYALSAPIPRYGTLEISTTPAEATVSIDGREIGTTPDIFSQVLIGTHTLRLSKAGRASMEQQITIEEGKTQTLSFTLATSGKVSIISGVRNTQIYIDGILKGTAPYTFESASSSHSVTAKADGYGDATCTVTVTAGQTTNLTLSPQPISSNHTFTVKGVTFTMILVEGGTFTMGATKKQKHQVTLGDYYIGETEVTQALWEAVMGNNPSNFTGNANRPVEYVRWNDCHEFIEKLNRLTGQMFRLPTEAEWEYAARGGNKSKGYKYAGGNTIGDVAWYDVNAYNVGSGSPDYGTHPVKSKQPNELGLYDMSGNVWEWCSDWYGSYSSTSQTNPAGPATGSDRVLRGGSWFSNARFCRVSVRDSSSPDFGYDHYGLRLVLSVQK